MGAFAYEYTIITAPFVEKTILSPLTCFGTQLATGCSISGLFSVALVCTTTFMPTLTSIHL